MPTSLQRRRWNNHIAGAQMPQLFLEGEIMTDATTILLAERQKTHGSFEVHARVTQQLKVIMESEENWRRLTPRHKESLHMIVHKIGRIMAGNPKFNDHWDDIAGYARLASEACK